MKVELNSIVIDLNEKEIKLFDVINDALKNNKPLNFTSEHFSKKTVGFIKKFTNEYMIGPYKPFEKPIKTNVIRDIIGDKWAGMVESLTTEELTELVCAGHDLKCEFLTDVCMLNIACLIKDRKPNDVLKLLGMPIPTKEDMDKVRDENPWVFEIGMETAQHLSKN